MKLTTVEALVTPRKILPSPDVPRAARMVRLTELVCRYCRPVVRPGCLTRGITLYRFLRLAGMDVSLTFGIGQIAGKFEGHCWLMKDGAPFLEKTDPHVIFTPTYSFSRLSPRLAQAPR